EGQHVPVIDTSGAWGPSARPTWSLRRSDDGARQRLRVLQRGAICGPIAVAVGRLAASAIAMPSALARQALLQSFMCSPSGGTDVSDGRGAVWDQRPHSA